MKRRSVMKRPTKKAFYEFMSMRFKDKYKDNEGYLTLLDLIQEADKSDEAFMDLVELTMMNHTDRLIYRNRQACLGIEMTPAQVNEYIAIVEYALEYVS